MEQKPRKISPRTGANNARDKGKSMKEKGQKSFLILFIYVRCVLTVSKAKYSLFNRNHPVQQVTLIIMLLNTIKSFSQKNKFHKTRHLRNIDPVVLHILLNISRLCFFYRWDLDCTTIMFKSGVKMHNEFLHIFPIFQNKIFPE